MNCAPLEHVQATPTLQFGNMAVGRITVRTACLSEFCSLSAFNRHHKFRTPPGPSASFVSRQPQISRRVLPNGFARKITESEPLRSSAPSILDLCSHEGHTVRRGNGCYTEREAEDASRAAPRSNQSPSIRNSRTARAQAGAGSSVCESKRSKPVRRILPGE